MATGKIDRRALPLPEAPQTSKPTLAQRSHTESMLADIWEELRLKHVSVHDNFFELGGHSLLATQLVSRVRDMFKTAFTQRVCSTNDRATGCSH
ncbi:phosphopantetheine-binding protein [Chroogloeocystis siderophila]|nr:phosphopantetheine-binding protein [Chroogloeocystis siderophila]